MEIKVWHCYHYGKHETSIIVAETDDILKSKVRGIIASEWREEDDGPMPEDFLDLIEAYHENFNDRYFGEWDWATINVALCEAQEEGA